MYFMQTLFSLKNSGSELSIIFIDSAWAATEHSFQLSYTIGKLIGGIHLFPIENEHTHIIKVNLIIDKLKENYILSYKNERKLYHMTDISKYKNVSLSKDTYAKIDRLRRMIVPNTVVSRSQTVNILVNEKVEKLNGKGKEK